jgi:hypothetical protein
MQVYLFITKTLPLPNTYPGLEPGTSGFVV